jgi:GNAT superfamily N-acetyltransferase
MHDLFDNIFWYTLTGAQAHFAAGAGGARRYVAGCSPILGFADQQQPDFAALAPYCEADEHFYTEGWSGPVPAGWRLDAETTMIKMFWDAPPPGPDAGADAIVTLDSTHVQRAVDLAALTRPGPFGPRTPELGIYIGCLEGERLIAMAGERACAGALREISGVCTHPDFQGRGLARRLMLRLIRAQMQRGETPVLHVMKANETAHGLYRRMGFRDHRESVVRVVTKLNA